MSRDMELCSPLFGDLWTCFVLYDTALWKVVCTKSLYGASCGRVSCPCRDSPVLPESNRTTLASQPVFSWSGMALHLVGSFLMPPSSPGQVRKPGNNGRRGFWHPSPLYHHRCWNAQHESGCCGRLQALWSGHSSHCIPLSIPLIWPSHCYRYFCTNQASLNHLCFCWLWRKCSRRMQWKLSGTWLAVEDQSWIFYPWKSMSNRPISRWRQ